jgi:hypothetical protein
MSGTILLLPLYACIGSTGTTLTVPLGLCINMVRKCSSSLEYEDMDPLELVSSSERHMYHFMYIYSRQVSKNFLFCVKCDVKGLWM